MGLTSQQIKNLAVGYLVWLYKQGQLGNGLYLYSVLGWLLVVVVFLLVGWIWLIRNCQTQPAHDGSFGDLLGCCCRQWGEIRHNQRRLDGLERCRSGQ